MKRWLINKFFKVYGNVVYQKLNEKDADRMFDFIAKSEETKKMGDFFRQCADAYKTKYLYSQDESLKGAILAFTQLAEKFESHTPKSKMKEAARQVKVSGGKKTRKLPVKY